MNKTITSSFGFFRVSICVPELKVADVFFNTSEVQTALERCIEEDSKLVLFPELCLTGYSCADLFYQSSLLQEAIDGVYRICEFTRKKNVATIVGAPLEVDGKIYNCAFFLSCGELKGIVPKTYLPNTNEFYEERWFTSAHYNSLSEVEVFGKAIPFGSDLIFQAESIPDCKIGIEICEDVWSVQPPSGEMAIQGATILCNPSASNELLSKSDYRKELIKQQSARCLATYLYSSCGPNESTTDLVYSGHSIIAENGSVLKETNLFQFSTQIITMDIDLEKIRNERIKNSSFSTSQSTKSFRKIPFPLTQADYKNLLRVVTKNPFVPTDQDKREKHCREIFSIQSSALAKRLKHTRVQNIVIGISGGLDSTLALLVCIKAYDILNLPHKGIFAITMPGFGTTTRTKTNASSLSSLLGTTLKTISIDEAVRIHFRDIEHDENVHDITYENSQARERTQILMDMSNKVKGLVIGTGDLSELALGWCTYNGDHISMYNVNCGVPKTLVKYLVEWCAEHEFSGDTSKVLKDICSTPISPELLPSDGTIISQHTEKSIGPYELHDFFLYYVVRHQFSPSKILYLTRKAYKDNYSDTEILNWLRTFYQRFFQNQFKRSAIPDGPKVGSVALSPRGDWRMPSDAVATLWLKEIENL